MGRTKTGFALLAAIVVTVGEVIGPVAASKALAGDYQVAYAIDAGGLRESGKYVECTYGKACILIFEKTSIHVETNTHRALQNRAHIVVVTIYDNRGCCYFSDGGSQISIDGGEPFHKLQIFEGRKRIGNEAVVNNMIGYLYLGF
jgi:hypothetical protein